MLSAHDTAPHQTARPEKTPPPHQTPPGGPLWRTGRQARRERIVVFVVAAALVLFRSAIFVFFDSVFDSDQAVVGLMAKHLGEGRALPVFKYGQDYQLAVEAWLAAPLFWLFGSSVLTLKLPVLLMNVALAVLLIALLERELGLRPALGLLVASPFVLTPPGTAIYFLETSGGQLQPLLAALLLWVTRRRPVTFGTILALGFLQRMFTAYALGALVLIELLDRSLLTAEGLRRKLTAAVAFTAVWQGVGLMRAQAGSAWGPATSESYARLPIATSDSAALNVGLVLDRVCIDVVSLPRNVIEFAGPFLSTMMGGHREPLAGLAIPSAGTQGLDGLWWLVGGALLLAAGRVGWHAARGDQRPWHPRLQFATYLILIGAQSSAVYLLSQCGRVDVLTMRYTLLTLLGVVGLVAYHAVIESRRPARRLVLGVLAVWAVVGLWGHTRLAVEFTRNPPVNNRQVLADYLVAHDIKYGYADFWDAYSTVFFANEEVFLASTSVWFIQEYEWIVQNHHDEAVWITRTPCDGGARATNAHYVCPPRPRN